jgi:hypothetical protein
MEGSSSFFAADLPALIFALAKAQEYVVTTPLPGEKDRNGSDEETPF